MRVTNADIHPLFQPFRLGGLELSNRLVMAPLTRNRAGAGNVAAPMTAEYYAQRASAGLIVSEGSQVSPMGQGYLATPGIHSAEQVEGWKPVTAAVHAAGGRIFMQLWHVGRISHVSLLPGQAAPLAPSAITAETKTYLGQGFEAVSAPRALEVSEIAGIVDDFRRAAANARAAGFDGVEIHGANGYLIDQFMKDGANKRDDAYGGSIDNRTRLLAEVTQAVCDQIGRDRVGVRLSPAGPINDCADSNPQPLFEMAVDKLNAIGPVYIHMIEGLTGQTRDTNPAVDFAALRRRFSGVYMANNCLNVDSAKAAIDSHAADLVSFGRDFIANPDLVRRLRQGADLNSLDRATLYGGGREGYVDYPSLPA
ncbi:alkene reductase [Magnetospirillum sp. J10]|uniref:Alkene reductase n=1 Tax=Magnetospirillum sulfuroxidans TaxID=611300 RepID=A0ABS5IB93_9PROT|nr:alkene reductase [Magnetospirillum sulfuroxidans]MBR9971412.1 alkene reductase [Magnetospirillum sulfuroxidans]